MRTFTIDSENNITVFANAKEAKTSSQTGAVIFTTEEELGKLATAAVVDMPTAFEYRFWHWQYSGTELLGCIKALRP